jgi:hypothetical protein
MSDIDIERKIKIIDLVSEYCDKNLDSEYKELCLRIIEKMSRKKIVPFSSGKIEIWAVGIIYAIGQINFLFDKSFLPYQSTDEICTYFNTSKSTASQKAKNIRDMFDLSYYDKEFSTKKMSDSNPLSDIVMINGFAVPKKILNDK